MNWLLANISQKPRIHQGIWMICDNDHGAVVFEEVLVFHLNLRIVEAHPDFDQYLDESIQHFVAENRKYSVIYSSNRESSSINLNFSAIRIVTKRRNVNIKAHTIALLHAAPKRLELDHESAKTHHRVYPSKHSE